MYGGRKSLTLSAGWGSNWIWRVLGVLFENKKYTNSRAQQCQSSASVPEKHSHMCPRRPRSGQQSQLSNNVKLEET